MPAWTPANAGRAQLCAHPSFEAEKTRQLLVLVLVLIPALSLSLSCTLSALPSCSLLCLRTHALPFSLRQDLQTTCQGKVSVGEWPLRRELSMGALIGVSIGAAGTLNGLLMWHIHSQHYVHAFCSPVPPSPARLEPPSPAPSQHSLTLTT